jgi:hypothetical protein
LCLSIDADPADLEYHKEKNGHSVAKQSGIQQKRGRRRFFPRRYTKIHEDTQRCIKVLSHNNTKKTGKTAG